MATVSVTVRSRFPQIRAQANLRAVAATTKAAIDVEAHAKQRAPVDTGNLKNSINANGGGLAWRVDSPADYSVYQEFGTSRMAPHPFLIPAAEFVRPLFVAAMKRIV